MNKHNFIENFLKAHHGFVLDESLSQTDQDSKLWIIVGSDSKKRYVIIVEFDANNQVVKKDGDVIQKERVRTIEIPYETNINVDMHLRLIITCTTDQKKNIYSLKGQELCRNVDEEHLKLFKKEIQHHLF